MCLELASDPHFLSAIVDVYVSILRTINNIIVNNMCGIFIVCFLQQ